MSNRAVLIEIKREEKVRVVLEKKKTQFPGPIFVETGMKRVKNQTTIWVTESEYSKNLPIVRVSVFLRTRDDFLVFVSRVTMEHASLSCGIQCVEGDIAARYLLSDQAFNIWENAADELRKKLYLDVENIEHITSFFPRFLMIWANGIRIIFEADTEFSRTELACHYVHNVRGEQYRGRGSEIQGIVCIPETPKDVRDFLKRDHRPKAEYIEPLLRELVRL